MDCLSLSDVEHIVQLISQAADPTIERPIPERKREIVCGVAQMIAADMWVWCTSKLDLAKPVDAMVFSLIDGGWSSGEERAQFFHALTHPDLLQTNSRAYELCHDRHLTIGPEMFVAEEHQQILTGFRNSTGIGDLLWSFYPLDATTNSCAAFYRRNDRPPYSDRDRTLVHVVFQQVDWLHRFGTDVPAQNTVLELSRREREVLVFLLGGDSQKLIARKLELSEYTIGDYVKRIYKHFSVSSRGELLAHFISGGQR
jgi:DNA-binding CsgD family transcriptional regulator